MIKPPVWKPQVPWYFFTGGLTGAASTFAFAAEVASHERLARRSWIVAMVAGTASPVLLITDLGRPERFLNMLRVFKVTSPMSVGSWVVAASGATNGIATATRVLGVMPRLGAAARVGAAARRAADGHLHRGPDRQHRRPRLARGPAELPFLFAASAAASAGAAVAIATPRADALPARRLTALGVLGAQAASVAMERRLGPLAAAYRDGDARRYGNLARGLTLGGAALVGLAGGRSRAAAVAGGLAVLGGAAAARWSVFKAGVASAHDPHQTIAPQRARMAAR